MTLDAGTERWRVPACDGGCTADHHPRADREPSHHGIADRARGIVEINVDSIGACRRQLFADGMARLVVDGNLVAKFVEAEFCLGWPTCDSNGAATHQLSDLADGRANRARSGRDDNGVSRTWLAVIKQSEISGDPVEAEHAKRQRQRQIGFRNLPCYCA